jgi:hypothetical protein
MQVQAPPWSGATRDNNPLVRPGKASEGLSYIPQGSLMETIRG